MSEPIELTVRAPEANQRVEAVLRNRLRELAGDSVSAADVRRLIAEGRVRIGGRTLRRASRRVRAGDRLVVDATLRALAGWAADRAGRVELDRDHVLFVDDTIIVIDKPAGLPSDATRDPKRDHAAAAAARWLASEAGAHSPLVFPVHRLDVATSGVLCLARTPDGATELGHAFAARDVRKEYEALAYDPNRALPDEIEVEDFLEHRGGRSRSVRSGGLLAQTRLTVLTRVGPLAHVLAKPRTGRTHQIRVHLAERGAPIAGDALYGDDPARGAAPRLMLHARRLSFRHPTTGAALVLEARAPLLFRQLLGS